MNYKKQFVEVLFLPDPWFLFSLLEHSSGYNGESLFVHLKSFSVGDNGEIRSQATDFFVKQRKLQQPVFKIYLIGQVSASEILLIFVVLVDPFL